MDSCSEPPDRPSTDRLPGGERLGALLRVLDLPGERLDPMVVAFPDELKAYTEFSVSDQDRRLGVMVRGQGPDFTRRVSRFMDAAGVAAPRLRRFEAAARYFEHVNLFFKVEVDAVGIQEMSWYFRRRPSVDVALQFLSADGLHDEAFVRRVASLLGKNTVHFVAGQESAGGASGAKLYFSQPDHPDAWTRIAAVARETDCGQAWEALDAQAEGLRGRFSFVSVGWSEGQRVPGFKLDVRQLGGGTLGRIVRGAGPDAIRRIHLLLSLYDKEGVDYAGFRLAPGRERSTKVYAAR